MLAADVLSRFAAANFYALGGRHSHYDYILLIFAHLSPRRLADGYDAFIFTTQHGT